jgi:hypothetical protein
VQEYGRPAIRLGRRRGSDPYDAAILTGTETPHAGRRTWIARAIAVLTVALAGLGVARPARSEAVPMPGPAVFTTGLVDDPAFVASSQSVRSEWLARARQVGSTTVRIGVVWADVAPRNRRRGFDASNPGDPNYTWSSIDAAVRTATADGQTVLLVVNHAPIWAQAPHRPSYVAPGSWDPSANAFAAFAHAIALRYSGTYPDPLQRLVDLPQVDYFQAWNEPNLPVYLMPQWVRGPHRSIVAESPILYRAMLNAFYAAVKAVRPQAVVLAAGTAPYGDPPGVDRMYPLVFLRDMFCLTSTLRPLPCSDPPHLDVLDHHPYNLGLAPTVPASVPNDLAVPDLGKIWRVLHVAQRAHHVLPAGPKSLWVTEIDWSTSRPVPLTQAVQAAYLSEGFYELWRQDVTHVYWFQLRDPPGAKDSFAGGGLYSVNGTPKLAATAFRFPFVALPAPHKNTSVILWGKAPAAGRVAIQMRMGSSWRTVRSLPTTRGGIFYAVTRLSSRLQLRATIGAFTSLAWVNG